MVNGEKPYVSIDEVVDLANAGDDFNVSFKSMIESIVAHGEKEKLASDMTDYLKKEMGVDEIKALMAGEAVDGYSDEDKELFSYLQSTLSLDWNAIYEAELAEQSEMAFQIEPSLKSVLDGSILI